MGVMKPRSVPTTKPHLYILLFLFLCLNILFVGYWMNTYLQKVGYCLWVSNLLFLRLNILGCCSHVFMIKMNTDLN